MRSSLLSRIITRSPYLHPTYMPISLVGSQYSLLGVLVKVLSDVPTGIVFQAGRRSSHGFAPQPRIATLLLGKPFRDSLAEVGGSVITRRDASAPLGHSISSTVEHHGEVVHNPAGWQAQDYPSSSAPGGLTFRISL